MDAALARGYELTPTGTEEDAWAELSVQGLRAGELDCRHPRRGEVWLAEMDKLRPAVVMHRDFAGRALNAVLVAPLTTTMRDIPTAVRLGPVDGLDRECMAALDNLTLLRKDRFVRSVAALSAERMAELCAALATAIACDVPTTRHRFGPGVDPPS